MASEESAPHLGYEKTLMYGRYTELSKFAKQFASSQRERSSSGSRQSRTLGIEEAKRRKSKTWRAWSWVSTQVLPYVIDWMFILILGLLMALFSFAIDYLIQKVDEARRILSFVLVTHIPAQYILWVFFALVFILFSVGFVQLVSIHAIGSGIPEMKTILRGIDLKDYLTIRTFISKIVGLVTAFGSGLPIGKEGPFVHLSSIIAHQMSKLITTVNQLYANEAHSNELLAAACAVGVSCNFAAPIGGVLFSIEVTATYFAVRNYWRGFFGAVCGAFLFRLAAVLFQDEETITALFKTSFRPDFPFDLQELLAFGFIGIACGFGGALLVWYHRNYVMAIRKIRKVKCFKILQYHIFILPAIVTLLFATLTFYPGFGQFMAGELSQRDTISQLFSNVTWVNLPDPSEIDELPVGSDDYQLVRQWGNPNIWVSLILFVIVRYIFVAIAVSLPIPSGVFFPIFIIGAGFGRLIGELMAMMFPGGINGRLISPGGYAVVGAAALAGASTHTISTSVIVFELTGQITHILPVMIAVLIANSISSLLQPSIYDSIILLKGLSYLPDLKINKVYNLYATDIMRKDIVFLTYESSFNDLKVLLQTSEHASYPLVDAPRSRILIGSISRENLESIMDDHLAGLYKHQRQIKGREQQHSFVASYKSDSEEVTLTPQEGVEHLASTPTGLGYSLSRRISSVPHSLAKIFGAQDETDSSHYASDDAEALSEEALESLREDLLSQSIDFKKCQIDPAPFQLVERTSLHKIHSLFSILTLSHAYVTSIGRLVGVVTLTDLTEAIQGKKQAPVSQRSRTRTFELVPPTSGGGGGGGGEGDDTTDQEIVSDSESGTEQQAINV